MFVRPNYKRSFIMLEKADKTISSKATGYLKEEIRDNKINIFVHVQNVDIKSDDNILEVYLLSKEEKNIEPYYLGNVLIKSNKNGEVVFNMKKTVLEKKGVNIDKYDTVVVLKHDIVQNDLSFYLVGFKNNSWNWKDVLSDYLINKDDKKTKFELEDKEDKNISEDSKSITKNGKEIENTLINDTTGDAEKEGENTDYKNKEENNDKSPKEKEDIKEDISEEKINDIMIIETDNKKLKEMIGNIQEKYEKIKVFNNKYPDCRWFKISDMLFLTKDLFECYKNLSYIYNYDINGAFYKHGHFLFGIELKDNNKIKNIYFGVPSKFGTESHPLLYVQQYANWVSKSADNPSIDEFGYWLIKINPQNGDLEYFTE